MIVVEQVIRRSGTVGSLCQGSSIHDEDVGPAVIVVIKNCDAGAGSFDDVFLAFFIAGDDFEFQARFLGNVLKVSHGRLGRLRQG